MFALRRFAQPCTWIQINAFFFSVFVPSPRLLFENDGDDVFLVCQFAFFVCHLELTHSTRSKRQELVANNFRGIYTSNPRAPCSSDDCIVLDVLAHFLLVICYRTQRTHLRRLGSVCTRNRGIFFVASKKRFYIFLWIFLFPLREERPTEGAEESKSEIETLKRENAKHDLWFSCYAPAVSAPTRSLHNLDGSMCFLATLQTECATQEIPTKRCSHIKLKTNVLKFGGGLSCCTKRTNTFDECMHIMLSVWQQQHQQHTPLRPSNSQSEHGMEILVWIVI